MISRLRPHLTYANVAVTLLAFVVLAGGGALAASSFVGRNGQIRGCVDKKGVLKLVKPSKSCGKGTTRVDWNQRGRQGPAGPFPGGNLPRGKTIRGNFYAEDSDTSAIQGDAFTSISFGFQLASAPTVEIVDPGGAATSGCPGSLSNPQAAPGTLCVYLATKNYLVYTDNPVTGTGAANRWGTNLFSYNSSGQSSASGTWAVTAP